MERQMISSEIIKSAGYDENSQTLEIEFANGVLCRYKEVQKNIFDELSSSVNPDDYFSEVIEDNYRKLKIV